MFEIIAEQLVACVFPVSQWVTNVHFRNAALASWFPENVVLVWQRPVECVRCFMEISARITVYYYLPFGIPTCTSNPTFLIVVMDVFMVISRWVTPLRA